MNLNQIKGIYFVGIGGIGMSAIARYFNALKIPVWGYDKTTTTLTSELEKEGLKICYEDSIETVDKDFLLYDSSEVLIVYTPAIPKNSKILNYFIDAKYILKKRSEVLGILSKAKYCIAVAGTHGKTTTSTLITYILKNAGLNPSAFLGGISANYNSNFILGESNYLIVEADEFDRSFLTLYPDISVITSMDPDHLDIYGDANSFKESFQLFASQLKIDGKLIRKNNLDLSTGKKYSLTFEKGSEFFAENIRIENGEYIFDLTLDELEIKNIQLGLPGIHNLENAIAAAAVALQLNISPSKIKEGIQNFKGVKRRFEYILKQKDVIYIDDYAHHPEELRSCFTSLKQLYPNKKILAVFQPHLFSRTRDFLEQFGEVLSMPNETILLPIYPARELPIEGINSEVLLERIKSDKKQLCTKEELIRTLKEKDFDVLVTVGAGDIDTCVEKIKLAYTK